MTKGIIYYTDNQLFEPLFSIVQSYIKKAQLPIVSVSLKPLDFGHNIVLSLTRGYVTYVKQIVAALSASSADYVFFCEHDVLYPLEHFDFTPPKDNIFYYNANVWRWYFGANTAVTYDRMLPLSTLCVNREYARDHYNLRLKNIMEHIEEFNSREPALARKWGYEPGTKKKKRGGLTDDDFDTFTSEYPVIDIRHQGAFSPPKCRLDNFKHQPLNWREIVIDFIPGWDLKGIFENAVKHTDTVS